MSRTQHPRKPKLPRAGRMPPPTVAFRVKKDVPARKAKHKRRFDAED